MMDSGLANRLQIWGFENGITVFKDFSLGAIFKITTLDISCQTDEAINQLKENLRQFLNGLPAGLSLQFMQEIVPGNIEVIRRHEQITNQSISDLNREIVDQRVKKFSDLDEAGLLPKQNLYLLVRKPFDKGPEKSGILSLFKKKEQHLSEAHLQSEIRSFDRILENLGSSLLALDVEAKKLTEQEVFNLTFDQWNPGHKIQAPSMSTQDVRDQVILTDAVLGLDHFVLGRRLHKVISLASPETGVWSANDISNDEKLPIKARRFSGPYSLESFDPKDKFVLRRNPLSLISKEFPDSPERIEIPLDDLAVCEDKMVKGDLDVFVKDPLPTGERDWRKIGVEVLKSSPSTLIYFSSVAPNEQQQKVAFEVLNEIWENSPFEDLLPATSLLPFEKAYKLEVESIKNELPAKTATQIRLGIPHTYFQKEFLDYLTSTFKKFGSDLQLVVLSREEYPKMFEDPKAFERVDYLLAPYAASERYPAVQLRFMTGKSKKSPVDLKEAETPELDEKQVKVLKDYQKWLLNSGHIVPLFFEKTFVLHQANIDLGIQEAPDSEVELWKLRRIN